MTRLTDAHAVHHEGTTMQTMAQTATLVARGRRLSWRDNA